MSLYYNGDLDKDLDYIRTLPYTSFLEDLSSKYGNGRIRQVIMWFDGREPPIRMNWDLKTDEVVELVLLIKRYSAPELIKVNQILWAEENRKMGIPPIVALGQE